MICNACKRGDHGYHSDEHLAFICIGCTCEWTPRRGALAEQGRQLASERDDLIAAGVDPSLLKHPLAPIDSGADPAFVSALAAWMSEHLAIDLLPWQRDLLAHWLTEGGLQ